MYALAEKSCIHCGTLVPASSGSAFCCGGCEAVYALLNERGLGRTYYELQRKDRSLRRAVPAPGDSESFAYLDDPDFLALYSDLDAASGERTMKFYLEGVHCAACVWLTEKLPEFVCDVRGARLDLGNSLAMIRMRAGGKFADAARELARLGYRPHAVSLGDAAELQKKENRGLLIRTGIAGACAGNIMLLAISVYGGATGEMARHFNWVSFGLFLPVILYCAQPFFRSAWSAFRARQVSIDHPVALGLLIGSVSSAANLVMGSDQVYFDSLSSLIFLLLASRYVLRRTQQSALAASNLVHFLTPSMVRLRGADGSYAETRLDAVKPGDVLRVLPGECIPADGTVLEGTGAVNLSLLTGEAAPVRIEEGKPVFAGTVNQQAPLLIRVGSSGSATRLGRILASVEESLSRKAPIVAFSDRVGRIFVTAVLVVIGFVLYLGFRENWHEALNRALALAIVTCPCAFALATPLALSTSIARCARAGILVKGGDSLERLSRVSTVYLDKTGTLTAGELEVTSLVASADASEVEGAVLALESRSMHPIARAFQRHLVPRVRQPLPAVLDFVEHAGRGVEGWIDGRHYEIRQAASTMSGTRVAVCRDGILLAEAALGDRMRPDSRASVEALHDLGLRVRILTGDSEGAAREAAFQLGIAPSDTIFQASPEKKAAIVREAGEAVMVGDGANDAVALASAFVGIAVHGGMEVSLRAADAYSCVAGVDPVRRLIVVARETMKVVRRNFAFSLLYNAAGIWATLTGHLSPLFAAVLMPISAFIVFISSMTGTGRLRRALEERS